MNHGWGNSNSGTSLIMDVTQHQGKYKSGEYVTRYEIEGLTIYFQIFVVRAVTCIKQSPDRLPIFPLNRN